MIPKLKEVLQLIKDLNLSSDVSRTAILDEEQNLTPSFTNFFDYLSWRLSNFSASVVGGIFYFFLIYNSSKIAGVLRSLGLRFSQLLSLEVFKALLISALVVSFSAYFYPNFFLNIFLKYYNELYCYLKFRATCFFSFFIAFGFRLFSMLVVNFNDFIYLKYAELKNVLLNINTGFSAKKSKKISKIKLGFYVLLLLLFWAAAVYFANSLTTASLFSVSGSGAGLPTDLRFCAIVFCFV